MADRNETVTIRAVSGDEEGRKKVKKVEAKIHNPDTLKHIEKKLADKGIQRLERHPVDGLGGIGRPPPKSGRGGKYTWEGPEGPVEVELEAAPPAIDEKDPNYVDEAEEERVAKEEGAVVGEIEVAKAAEAKEGVARIEVHPHLNI